MWATDSAAAAQPVLGNGLDERPSVVSTLCPLPGAAVKQLPSVVHDNRGNHLFEEPLIAWLHLRISQASGPPNLDTFCTAWHRPSSTYPAYHCALLQHVHGMLQPQMMLWHDAHLAIFACGALEVSEAWCHSDVLVVCHGFQTMKLAYPQRLCWPAVQIAVAQECIDSDVFAPVLNKIFASATRKQQGTSFRSPRSSSRMLAALGRLNRPSLDSAASPTSVRESLEPSPQFKGGKGLAKCAAPACPSPML